MRNGAASPRASGRYRAIEPIRTDRPLQSSPVLSSPLDRPAVVSPPLTARAVSALLRNVMKRTVYVRLDVFLPLSLSLFLFLLSLSLTDPSRHARFPLFFSRLAARSLTHLSVFGWPCPFALIRAHSRTRVALDASPVRALVNPRASELKRADSRGSTFDALPEHPNSSA